MTTLNRVPRVPADLIWRIWERLQRLRRKAGCCPFSGHHCLFWSASLATVLRFPVANHSTFHSKVLLSETRPENGQGRILSCHQWSLRRESTLIGQQEAQASGLVRVCFSELKVHGERWHYFVSSLQALNYERNLGSHRIGAKVPSFLENRLTSDRTHEVGPVLGPRGCFLFEMWWGQLCSALPQTLLNIFQGWEKKPRGKEGTLGLESHARLGGLKSIGILCPQGVR